MERIGKTTSHGKRGFIKRKIIFHKKSLHFEEITEVLTRILHHSTNSFEIKSL